MSWRIAGKIALWCLGVVLVLALVATGLVVWSVRRAFPVLDGDIKLAVLSSPVTVYRDAHGIPQLYARTAEDLFRAQGYVHAQDRFWEMDFRRHVTAGRLAELFGESQVPTDAFLRTLGWRRVAEQEWNQLPAHVKRLLEAYAEGVNAWIDDHGGAEPSGQKGLEYTLLGLTNSDYRVEPWHPVDTLAWIKAMAWDLRGNMQAEITRSVLLASGLTREQVEQLYPEYPYQRHRPIVDTGAIVDGAFDAEATPPPLPPAAAPVLADLAAALQRLPRALSLAGPDVGSNSWVIGGSLTTTGKPLLANDPHLSASMPGIWYQMGLHCECEFNVEGFTFAGVPGVIIGHNGRIAWGFTNLGPDVTDLYVERIDGDRVLDGTEWTPLSTRQETIRVAGGEPVTITVRSSRHGPLLSDRSQELLGIATAPPVGPSGEPLQSRSPAPTPSLDPTAEGVPASAASSPYAVALRWTALDPGRTAEALFALNTATNWSEFRAAASLFDVPAQNLIYADVDGNIGYQAPGRIPIRGKGDGTWPSPGWDRAYDWTGFIPFPQLPNVYNPKEGWVVTANQAVVGPQYPHLLTKDWAYGYRSQRIVDMLLERTATGKIDVEAVRQMQFDNRNGFAPTLVPYLLDVAADGDVARARELLRDWDFQQGADSAAAAFYNATWRHLLARTFDELPEGYRPDGGDRWWEVVRGLLEQPDSAWWDDKSTATLEDRSDILAAAMADAVAELRERLGDDPNAWRWGDLHTLELENASFGRSGIALIERLFNRGPVATSGGSGIVNATGWVASRGYEVTAVPSMRMIVDLSDLDSSRWVVLTGNSGHAFSPHYTDQLELWRTGQTLPMRWERATIEAEAKHTLTLSP